ncbi:hypothetical protein [Nocardia sp. CA-290969]|uniref:hypothetical protein n=1 Tax=Nocardia sp. CA-290969 TaxID=3239986 RepID=UPI003D8C4D6B
MMGSGPHAEKQISLPRQVVAALGGGDGVGHAQTEAEPVGDVGFDGGEFGDQPGRGEPEE